MKPARHQRCDKLVQVGKEKHDPGEIAKIIRTLTKYGTATG